MLRRRCLQVAGIGLGIGTSGCLGGGETTTAANEFDYETTITDGVAVPLVPVADAIEWYQADDVVFADARSRTAFESAHVTDSVFSPAPDGQDVEDPVEARSSDTRVVTYCGCPHHLSSLRAASLIAAGYAHTYALDEGFHAWVDQGHPVEGSAVDSQPAAYTISGQLSDPDRDARVWAWHDPSGQREMTPVEADGSFALTLHFYDLTPDSPIRLVGPDSEVTQPLGDLTGTTVTL
jgi:rhodanese-related sulfurtransferase